MGSVDNRGTKDRPNYYCRYVDLDGKRKQVRTKQPTKALALRFLADIESRVARGEPGIPDRKKQHAKHITVRELVTRFLTEYNPPRLRDRARYIAEIKSNFQARLLPFPIADMAAASVKKQDVSAYRDALRKSYANATINLSLSKLSLLFSWAIDSELIDCRNPCRVQRMTTTPSEEHYTREHVERLLSPEHLDPMVATALYTAMRIGELYGLRWDCVRFDISAIVVKASFTGLPKNGKARTIPIHAELMPILTAWREQSPQTAQGLVFPVKTRTGYHMGSNDDGRRIRPSLEAANVPSTFRNPWHAMKHTATTLMAESGVHPSAIDVITAHSSGGNRITAGYTHLTSLDFLSRELAKMTLKPREPGKVIPLHSARQTA